MDVGEFSLDGTDSLVFSLSGSVEILSSPAVLELSVSESDGEKALQPATPVAVPTVVYRRNSRRDHCTISSTNSY
jgi:hypothetical protein